MKFIYINDEKVHEIINEFDPTFPDIPIDKRYSQDFLKKCVVLEDDKIPPIGYIKKGKEFEKPPKITIQVLTKRDRRLMLLKELEELEKLIKEEEKGTI